MAEVPFRILERYGKHAFDGSIKFIVLLREPVSRMISSWQYKFDSEAHVRPTFIDELSNCVFDLPSGHALP